MKVNSFYLRRATSVAIKLSALRSELENLAPSDHEPYGLDTPAYYEIRATITNLENAMDGLTTLITKRTRVW
jgi:hypothetical protein